MSPIAFIAGLCVVGLSWQFLQSRCGRGSGQFVLGILPTALLLLTVSIPPTVWKLLEAFRRIAEQGSGGLAVVAPFCIGIDRALWLGSLLFLVVMGTAGLLQAWAGLGQREPQTFPDAPVGGSRWRRWLVIASTLLVIPVAFLSHLTAGIPRLVMRVCALAGDRQLGPEATQQASATISNQTVLAVFAGLALSSILVVCAIANLLAAHSRTALDSLDRYSWVVLAGVGAWVVWSLAGLSTDLNSFRVALR
jgi:hypothetical protein